MYSLDIVTDTVQRSIPVFRDATLFRAGETGRLVVPMTTVAPISIVVGILQDAAA